MAREQTIECRLVAPAGAVEQFDRRGRVHVTVITPLSGRFPPVIH